MSRSNNTELVNPSVRWFEWSGSKGIVEYYDKTEEKKVEVSLPFTFIVLDQLATVKGWHDPSESGIYSNEVRDTTKQPLVVKSFKGGLIADGFYRDIKDRVKANGGHFVSNIYIAFKDKDVFYIGSIQFKGAALNSWAEFRNKNRKEIMSKAVTIIGTDTGQKGSITFLNPVFGLKDISDNTNNIAIDLDKELQDYLNKYLEKIPVKEQIAEQTNEANPIGGSSNITDEEDDLPF